jgi:hypothetical protein
MRQFDSKFQAGVLSWLHVINLDGSVLASMDGSVVRVHLEYRQSV